MEIDSASFMESTRRFDATTRSLDMSNAITIIRTIATFDTGHMLSEYIPATGALAGQRRIGFVTKSGKPCKSVPHGVQPVGDTEPTPPAAQPAQPAAQPAAVAVQPTTQPAQPKRKAKRQHPTRKGLTWQAFNGECRAAGLTMKQAGRLWKGAKGKVTGAQLHIIDTAVRNEWPLHVEAAPAARPTYDMAGNVTEYVVMYEHDGNEVEVECLDMDEDGYTLPYQPESERGNPVPQYGKTEWPCPSEEVIEEEARSLRAETQAFLRNIEGRLN